MTAGLMREAKKEYSKFSFCIAEVCSNSTEGTHCT
jgi:hypothetical protein